MKAKLCRLLSTADFMSTDRNVVSVIIEDEDGNELIYGREMDRWGREHTELAVYPIPEGIREDYPGLDVFVSDGIQTRVVKSDWLVGVHEAEVDERDPRWIKVLNDYNEAEKISALREKIRRGGSPTVEEVRHLGEAMFKKMLESMEGEEDD